jgi:hypothetical protein
LRQRGFEGNLIMRKAELCLAIVIAGILLAVWPKSASATSLPVPNKALDTATHSGGVTLTRGYSYYVYGVPYYVYGSPYYDYYGYGLPYVESGPNGGRCDWYYRNAINTGSSYWSDRYYEKCTGY